MHEHTGHLLVEHSRLQHSFDLFSFIFSAQTYVSTHASVCVCVCQCVCVFVCDQETFLVGRFLAFFALAALFFSFLFSFFHFGAHKKAAFRLSASRLDETSVRLADDCVSVCVSVCVCVCREMTAKAGTGHGHGQAMQSPSRRSGSASKVEPFLGWPTA